MSANPPKVYAAICKVMREIAKEGIAKTRDNQQTRSKFRGIDDVYNALCIPLADAGLVILPTLVEHAQTERESKSGGALYCSTVVVDYHFVCVEDGSSHTARVVGEAMDSSDKSFSKAMSFAFKYVCFQAFCIPTEGDNDADAHRPEAKPRAPAPRREEPLTIEEFISCRVDDVRSAISDRRAAHEREWWKTYRAALTGRCAYCSDERGFREDEAHDAAARSADLAHGPLKNEVQP